MTPDVHHIPIIGRYRQGQTTLMTSRSQGQSQGHQGHFRFFADCDLIAFSLSKIESDTRAIYYPAPAADPISLDMSLFCENWECFKHE